MANKLDEARQIIKEAFDLYDKNKEHLVGYEK